MFKRILIAGAALTLAGCTSTSEPRLTREAQIAQQCRNMGFRDNTDAFANCRLQITQTAMSAAPMPMMLPPTVDFQPMAMPQRYGTQTVRVQANCSSYGVGGYVNTSCY